MEAICVKGERPPIPGNCLPSLKALLEDLWDADPDRRPNFDEVNARLDEILVEAAISDAKGREFWKKYFLRQHHVKWDEFVERFYAFIDQDLPEDAGGPTADTQILNLRCLKALVGTVCVCVALCVSLCVPCDSRVCRVVCRACKCSGEEEGVGQGRG
jgi:hypothetical protein